MLVDSKGIRWPMLNFRCKGFCAEGVILHAQAEKDLHQSRATLMSSVWFPIWCLKSVATAVAAVTFPPAGGRSRKC